MKAAPVLILGSQGYIGSALAAHLQGTGVPFSSVDLGWRGTPAPLPTQRRPYQELTVEELSEFGSIVLLAGHSSVAACDRSPAEAFANNVTGFVKLVHKLRGQKLIYASSISVYVETRGHPAREDEPLPPPVSYYDLHKQTIERYAALAYPNAYALRLGTVCGPAPNIRPELLLNSLVRSALREGRVQVANRSGHRPLLGIGDLCRAVERLVRESLPPGCYNLASVNIQIGAVADYVARRFGVPCQEVEQQNRYDIRVDKRKASRTLGMSFEDDVVGLVESLREFYAEHP